MTLQVDINLRVRNFDVNYILQLVPMTATTNGS